LILDWFLALLTLWYWRWKQYVPPKQEASSRLHSITAQKTILFRNYWWLRSLVAFHEILGKVAEAVILPNWIWEGTQFKSWPGQWLSWQIFLVVWLSPSRQMPEQYLKFGHDYLLSSSSFSDHHRIWCYMVWVTDSIIKKILQINFIICGPNGRHGNCCWV
jgi:hypothetical protein